MYIIEYKDGKKEQTESLKDIHIILKEYYTSSTVTWMLYKKGEIESPTCKITEIK